MPKSSIHSVYNQCAKDLKKEKQGYRSNAFLDAMEYKNPFLFASQLSFKDTRNFLLLLWPTKNGLHKKPSPYYTQVIVLLLVYPLYVSVQVMINIGHNSTAVSIFAELKTQAMFAVRKYDHICKSKSKFNVVQSTRINSKLIS